MATRDITIHPEMLGIKDQGIFEADFDRLELEDSLGLNKQKRRSPRQVDIVSEEHREIRRHVNEILGRPRWRQHLFEYMTEPFEEVGNVAYNHFHAQFIKSGLRFEAQFLSAVITGLFGTTKGGNKALDYTTYDGEPSLGALALENAGIITLPRRQMRSNEVFTDSFLEKSEDLVNRLGEKASKKFMKLMNEKGQELGSVVKQRFPKLERDGQMLLVDTIGERFGEVFAEAIQQNGIDDKGNTYWGGKAYNIYDTNSLADMINDATNDKYPLQENAPVKKPGSVAKDVKATRAKGNDRPLQTV